MRHKKYPVIGVLSALMTALLVIMLLPTALAQKPLFDTNTDQPDLAIPAPENPHQLGRRTAGYADPERLMSSAGGEEPTGTYLLWQDGITYSSALGPAALIHGREDVLANAEAIRKWAPADLELLVAASIAHQASDVKDRPFGLNLVEEFWREHVNANASVGIAQLRPEEVGYWAPEMVGCDLLTPEVAIRVMTAKLAKANRAIKLAYPDASDSDRYMLLALAQNASSDLTVQKTIDYFFQEAGQDWQAMLASEWGQEQDWQEQLRLVLVHLDWLLTQGWEKPAGLDRDYWARLAFTE